MTPTSADLIDAMASAINSFHVKLELYDFNMRYLKEITRQIAKDNLGELSVGMDRPIRRSFSFSLNNQHNEFDWGEESLIWLDKRVKLFVGLRLWNGEIEYVPQGLFILSEPSDSHTSQGKITNISGQDKMFLMTDKRGKFLNDLTIEEETDISTAIRLIAGGVGETLFNFDPIDKKVPYELTYNAQDNRYNAIKELADLAECDIYYDVHGYLRLRKINLNEIESNPSVWTFKQGDRFYAGNIRKMDEDNLANTIRVLGGSGQTATVLYDLKVDEEATQSVYYSDIEEADFNLGERTNLVFRSGLILDKNGESIMLREETEEDFSSGTLKDVVYVDDGLELATSKLEGSRTTPPINLSNVGKYSNSKLMWAYEYDIDIISSFKIESRISKDNQATWSEWKEQTYNSSIEGLESGQSLTNTYVQFRQTMTREEASEEGERATIKLMWFQAEITPTFKDSGTYLSSEIKFDAGTDEETKHIHLSLTKEVPNGSSVELELRYKIDDIWSNWEKLDDESTIASLQNKRKVEDFTYQYRITLSKSDDDKSPLIRAVSINADVEDFWKGSPYSIQKIGEVSYFHNDGNPDPLITLKEEAVWRGKYELMQKLGYSEKVSLDSSPIFLFDAGDVVEIIDEHNSVNGKYLIEAFSLPLSLDLMTLECKKQRRFIDNWNFM